MRKAFTLIELMVTILIATIFLNFVFRFYANVLMEVRYLEAKDSLTYNGFRALQIVKNGVQGNGGYISGIVTLDNRTAINNNTYNSFTYGSNTKIEVIDNKLKISNDSNIYELNNLNINSFLLKDEIDNKGLYLFEIQASQKSLLNYSPLNQTETVTFQRLVYTK